MKDTTPEVEKRFYEMMMARSGAERLIMGSRMFDAARAIVTASLPRDLTEEQFKHRLFKRIYGKPLEQVLNTVRDGPEDEL